MTEEPRIRSIVGVESGATGESAAADVLFETPFAALESPLMVHLELVTVRRRFLRILDKSMTTAR